MSHKLSLATVDRGPSVYILGSFNQLLTPPEYTDEINYELCERRSRLDEDRSKLAS